MSQVLDPFSQSPHPLVGSVLRATYEVKSLLDRGGMGLVFEAEQIRLRRKVAIKILPVHLAQEPQALQRFQREAELVSLLQHPHVVQIVDFDTTEQGEPFIVMEFLSGESLELRLARQPQLPLDFAVRVALQVASGLAAVHSALIVHRDLKPANIFLTELSEGVHVKLLDFGIGKRLGGQPRLTGENDVMGTPDYMPPEQAQGKTAEVDQRGDQYSLSVIVYEMLAGRGPFVGDTMEILEQVISQEAPPIETLVPDLPPEVGPVLRRAMAKDPEQRFQTVMDFANALSAAVARPLTTHHAPSTDSVRSGERLFAGQPSARGLPHQLRATSPALGQGSRRVAEGHSVISSEAPPTLTDLLLALSEARKARSARDVELAATLVERALTIADQLNDSESAAALAREEALIEGSLEMSLGRRDRALRVQPPWVGEGQALLPEEAFLLSRIDDLSSMEEVLDLSPLPRVRTLRLLVRMLRRNLLGTGVV